MPNQQLPTSLPNCEVRVIKGSLAQRFSYCAPNINRKRSNQFDPHLSFRVAKGHPPRMERLSIHAKSIHAPIEAIADDRMPDGCKVKAQLMGAA